MTPARTASISLDLDDEWTYLKTRGDDHWQGYPTYLGRVVDDALALAERHRFQMTVFVVGADAARSDRAAALGELGQSAHEIGNHSFDHEPWFAGESEERIAGDLQRASDAIVAATGKPVRGFRSPGYALSPAVLEAVASLGFDYDASSLPTAIGPLARAYYFASSSLSAEERAKRSALFGSWRDALRPLRPYELPTAHGSLREMPVTTLPYLRLPIHFSYLLYLAAYSEAAADAYFALALGVCRFHGIGPSLLLHPLDFLDATIVPRLAFFPAMSIGRERKRALLDRWMARYVATFRVVPVGEHVRALAV